MFDRKLTNPMPIPKPKSRIRYRIETLVGITGARMAKYRDTWTEAVFPILNIAWRPHLLSVLLFEGALFGFGIGMNVTNAVFLQLPHPEGYQFDQLAIAGAYGTPIVRSISFRAQLLIERVLRSLSSSESCLATTSTTGS